MLANSAQGAVFAEVKNEPLGKMLDLLCPADEDSSYGIDEIRLSDTSSNSDFRNDEELFSGDEDKTFSLVSESPADKSANALRASCLNSLRPNLSEGRHSNIQKARAAHRKLSYRPKITEPLNLVERQRTKDSSFVGLDIFHRIQKWITEVDDNGHKKENPVSNSIGHSDEEDAALSSSIPKGVQLGLEARGVVDIRVYDPSLRQKAQQLVLEGKRHVSFLNATQVVIIPNRESIPTKIQRRLWPSRDYFMAMVVRNMQQLEHELNKKRPRKS